MSLVKQIEFKEIVKKQLVFKLKAYHNLIGSLILFQLIALFFSLFGQMTSFSTNFITVTTNIYSADVIISFTLLWMFVMAFYITNRTAKNMMFTFVTDKVSNHMANFLFMLCLAILGSITSVLLGFATRLGIVFYYGVEQIKFIDYITVLDLLTTIFITFLYHILVFSIGYLISEVIQLHKSFLILVPILLFSLFILSVNLFNEEFIFSFFIMETSLSLFLLKVLSVVLIIWFIAIRFDKRMEVRRG